MTKMKINQSNRRRVFLDIDSLTQWDRGIFQRFPQAEKIPIYRLEAGPIGSWDDGITSIWGTVIKETGLFRMWYWGQRLASSTQERADHPMVCYAESEDGIHWRKPDLKITGQKRWPGNNLLTLPGAPMSFVRALPGTDAKYLAVTIVYPIPLERDVQDVPGNPDPLKGGHGTHIWASDDGLHWRHVTRVLAHGDWACLYADRATDRYILYNKVPGMHGLTTRRMAIGLESRDGKHWEGYDGFRQWRETFVADDYDDLIAQQRGWLHAEIYGVGVYRAGEILVSIESILNVGSPVRQMFGANPMGLFHVRLGFSHDGFRWRYPKGRPVWMDIGEPGQQDAGCIVPSSTLVEDGDDLLFYYGGTTGDHCWSLNPDFSYRIDPAEEHGSCRVMMAKIKRDRFASLASTYRDCFDVDADQRQGDGLCVNALARNGSVRVAIAEKYDHDLGTIRKHDHLPGFSFDDCVPIAGDHVHAPVQFRKAKVADIPVGTPITLRFELSRAEVFGYEWGNG